MGTGATGARSARSMSPELRAMWAGPRARDAGSKVQLGEKLHADMALPTMAVKKQQRGFTGVKR
eukprot:3021030-Lingulodinium_polyedra.AAC.1